MWRRERAARRPDPGAPPPPPSHAHLDARMGGLRRSGVAVDAVPAAWKGIVFGFYGNEKCTWPFSAGDVAIFLPRVERALAVAGSLPPILVERKDVGLLLLDAPVEAAAGPLLFALREALHRTDRLLELLCILADDICAFLTDAERHNLDIALPDRMFDTLRGTRRRRTRGLGTAVAAGRRRRPTARAGSSTASSTRWARRCCTTRSGSTC